MLDSRIIIPDTHIPYHDRRAMASILHYIRWRQSPHTRVAPLSGLIQLGDFLDMEPLSRHNVDKRRLQENQRVQGEFDAGNQVLDEWQDALGERASLDLIEGNHEARTTSYVDKYPELEGLLDVPTGLRLAARGARWWPFWSKGHKGGILRVGKARFGHGRFTNKYHAAKHAQEYGENFFYGHVHNVMSHSISYLGENRVIAAESLGCLCDLSRDWMQGKPDKWEHAFGVFYFQPSGRFNHFVVRIFGGQFVSPEGELFTPKGIRHLGESA